MKFKIIISILSFIYGFCILADEIVLTKIITPYYGNSILVWSNTLLFVIFGLALGYMITFFIQSRFKICLVSINAMLILLELFILIFSKDLLLFFVSNDYSYALVSCCFLLPLFTLFGCTSPLLIKISKNVDQEFISNRIFGISTFAGVFAILIFGFILMPFYGLQFSLSALVTLLIINILIIIFVSKWEN